MSTTLQRHVIWVALSALLALIAPAAQAAPVFTPIVQVWCEFEADCIPEVPVTQMIETAPGLFVYVGEYGIMYTLTSTGTYTQGYILNDTNTMNSTPLQASDGNIYVPTSISAADGGSMVAEFDSKVNWLQNIGTPAYPYGEPLVETPDQLLWGTSTPAYYDAARFTLPLGGPATALPNLPEALAVSTFLVSSRGELYGLASSALLKFASDGSYTTLATFSGAVPGLIEASDGKLYGQTTGSLYSSGVYAATIWSLDLGLPLPQPVIVRA